MTMPRGRSNSVVAPALPIAPGGGLSNTHLGVFLRFLRILVTFVLFIYLLITTSNPALDDQSENPLHKARQAGLGLQRGQRQALVEAAPPVAHHNAEGHDGAQVDEIHLPVCAVLVPALVAMISVSIMSIIGSMPMVDIIRALTGLFPVVIQAGFIEAEVSGASCLDPGHSGTGGSALHCRPL
ncbi:hypothetical protein ACGC1H_005383 [Rhizoctonia solani]